MHSQQNIQIQKGKFENCTSVCWFYKEVLQYFTSETDKYVDFDVVGQVRQMRSIYSERMRTSYLL